MSPDLGSGRQSSEAAWAAMGESCLCLESFGQLVIKCKRGVLIFWLVITVCLAYPAAKFEDVLQISLESPPGSKSDIAQKLFDAHYPRLAFNSQSVGYLEAVTGSIEDVPGLDRYIRELQRHLDEVHPLSAFMSTTTISDIMAPLGDSIPPIKLPLVSEDKSAMLIMYSVALDPASLKSRLWGRQTHDLFLTFTREKLGNYLSFYGTNSYTEAADQAITVGKEDTAKGDVFSIPLAAVILFIVVESGRLLIIPGLSMIVNCVACYSCMWFIGLFMTVQSITPALMMCLIVSMTVDYSIFMLTRFKEEINAQLENALDDTLQPEEVEAAILATMATSGATVLLSGVTLCTSFVFLAIFPVSLLASMGIGACVTMVIMVSVNLTICPAILATFPRFFLGGVQGKSSACSRSLHTLTESFWSSIARITTTFPCNVLLLIFVITGTVFASLPWRTATIDFDMRQAMATGSFLLKTSNRINVKFGGGLVYPYQVLVVPSDPLEKVLSDKFFTDSGALLQELNDGLKHHMPVVGNKTSFNFISFRSDVGLVPFDQLAQLCQLPGQGDLEDADPEEAATFAPLCSYFFDSMTNAEDFRKAPPTAAYGLIFGGVDPICAVGNVMTHYLRENAERLGMKYGMEVAISGTAVKAIDTLDVVYQAMVPAIVGTYITAALFLAFAFRSMVTPVRAVVSSLLTLGITYGLTKLVYQDGILDFLGIQSLSSAYHALPWFPPVVIFFVVIGVGLDYDIFLLVRVTELRGQGCDPQYAIQKGLVSTAGIITAAGLVLVIAFAGMQLSTMSELNLFGFAIVIAVLYDTFVARSLVNPAVMSLLGHANWWPSALWHQEVSRSGSAKSTPRSNSQRNREEVESDTSETQVFKTLLRNESASLSPGR